MGADGGLIVLTGRDGHGQVRQLQQLLGWPVLVQEQEAYLLPGVARLSSFAGRLEPSKGVALLWTPGPSPGACVLHLRRDEDDGLFCGRLLVPMAPGALAPLRTVRTFHWRRQLASLQQVLTWLPAGSPVWIATGAGLGALRGQSLVANGAEQLKTLAAQAF
jgi:glyoxylase-like metal-dependent hydrolase (beta-lactamase superfamily II)